MARTVRVWFEGARFHVTSRGNRRSALFFDEEDYERYLAIAGETMERYPFRLLAYCLMTNHVHLQIETLQTPLSTIMKYLNTKYAKYFNRKYDFSGHVFEKRYNDELLNSPEYEIDASKYIHLNPVAAGIVSAAEDYRWNSYRTYIHGEKNPLLSPQLILSYFPHPASHYYELYTKSHYNDKIFWENGKIFCMEWDDVL